MDSLPLETLQPTTTTSERRRVTGRYRVRVDELAATGEAVGRVTETLVAPDQAEFAQVFRSRVDAEAVPAEFTFIGGLPGEIMDIEASWSLPRPGRKPARHVPPPIVRVIAVRNPTSLRQTPRCPIFGECGGCQLQHLDYEAQLSWKGERVHRALLREGVHAPDLLPTVPCEPPWAYRNHMRFSVNREGQAGLTARGTHRVIPLRECPIAHPQINAALSELAGETLPRPQLMLRYAESSRQMLAHPQPPIAARERIADHGIELHEGDMEDQLQGETFRIRPSSFFQTNSRQAEQMARMVLESLEPMTGGTYIDAYCGVGTFAKLIARQTAKVIAIEESASAIRDARWNLRDLANVEIMQGKVEDILPGLDTQLDGLVIDPPRAGCYPPVLQALRARRIPRVVYVSCNPDTLARDLAYLTHGEPVYRVASVRPLDMFPQTAHVETVALLETI
jgi:23S rRNA (uracil1939-C5)-methyltransferase